VSKAVYFFIAVRLFLGLFGMDLYEIYWWFSSGLAISLFNINKYSEIKTEKLLDSVALTT
jgi:putative inorganic carbon (HCO3(-)) transporter